MGKLGDSMRGRVGSSDRIQRLVIGLVLMALTIFGLARDPAWTLWVALAVQVELVSTALGGWCPLYWSFGTNSCQVR